LGRLLIVDDEDAFRRAVRRTLERAGHWVAEASHVAAARRILALGQIELVLCDINMPGGSGLELVRALTDELDTAVVMVTGVDDPEVAQAALAIGAYGYLVKPIGANTLLISVASALRRRDLEIARRAYVTELETKVFGRSAALRAALERLEQFEEHARHAERDAVDRLVVALTLRSEETGAHIRRVALYSGLLARVSGVDASHEEQIRLAAMLHDVGKIGVPDAILLKEGPLNDGEREIIERHAVLGRFLLANGDSAVLALGAEIAFTHHERWDGAGYPRGLVDDQIPLSGRITGIADVFDALTSDRVYRPALPIETAIEQMRAERDRHFDPELLDLFLGSVDEIEAIRAAHPDRTALA
jgi:putative two-component system response regulator